MEDKNLEALGRLSMESLDRIAEPLPERSRRRMVERRANRKLYLASAAIAAKIERQLRLRGITKVELAGKLGVTPACITRYLSGKANLQLKTLVEIEDAIDVHIIDRDIIPRVQKAPAVQIITLPSSYRVPEFKATQGSAFSVFSRFDTAMMPLACEEEAEYNKYKCMEYA